MSRRAASSSAASTTSTIRNGRRTSTERRAGADRIHPDVPRLPSRGGDADGDGGADPGAGGRAGSARAGGRLLVDRPDHAGGPREAPRGRLRAPGSARGRRTDPRPAAVAGVPLPLLRLERHDPREHLRADAVPLAAVLPEL